MKQNTSIALRLLRAHPSYIDDAREGAPVGNSVIGSMMSLQYGVPRQYAEAAVREALKRLAQRRA